MKKLVVISDTHIASNNPESLSLFPAYMNSHAGEYAKTFKCLDVFNTSLNSWLEKNKPIDILIHLGDLTTGWSEQGIHHREVEKLAVDAVNSYKNIAQSVNICWGNHDVGYGNTIGGICFESLERCNDISPLYWSFLSEDVLFIGICSSLVEYVGQDKKILNLKYKQIQFIQGILSNNKGRYWVLCSHEYDFDEDLIQVITPYRDFLKRHLYGDKHMVWAGHFFKIMAHINLKTLSKIRRKSILCPSVAPLWCRGGILLEGCIKGENLSLARKSFNTRDQAGSFPFCRALRAMLYQIFSKKKREVLTDLI